MVSSSRDNNDSENAKNNSVSIVGGQKYYNIGTVLLAKWFDGSVRLCNVIERRKIDRDDGSVDIKYYVHWNDFNRRMDEWISADSIVQEGTEEDVKNVHEKAAAEKASEEAEGVSGDERAMRTRGQKKKVDDDHEYADADEHDEHEGMDAASIREHEEVTKVKNVRFVEIGKYRMATWYFSPFPKEYFPDGSVDCLYFCEFCMSFFRHKIELSRHQAKRICPRHPPGNEIYRHENLAFFEVDGAVSKTYGQNLCYFAKLFLDHKTLYYDVDPFLFYVMCEVDSRGFHPVGYFSKEKYSEMGFNLACILTFPCHQRKGYGNFIIQFSYELSKKEEKVGSPEKPLSDLGLVSYRSYWTKVLLRLLKDLNVNQISVMDLTKLTSIKSDDIIGTLQALNVIKYWNGQYILVISPEMVEEQLGKVNKKGPTVNPEKLHWAPLLVDVKRDKWSLKAKRSHDEE